MAKTGSLGMALQQGLSFSSVLLHIPRAEAVFWPGCALMKLDPAILKKTMEVLRRTEPELALASGCCGQPTVYLFPEKSEKRQKSLTDAFRSSGVRRIYTACPNCTAQMKSLDGVQIIPIWTPLARNLKPEDLAFCADSFVWHDPCPIRHDPGQLAAVRKLLALSGCDYTEPLHTGPNTRCCGSICMLRTTDPEKSAAIRRRRLAELEESRTILSCCEGCLDAFRTEGRDTCHLLELLFGRSAKRTWGNHFQNAKKAPLD